MAILGATAMLLLTACSSSESDATAASSGQAGDSASITTEPASPGAESAATGETDEPSSSAPQTTEPAPASTAQSPVASYPADPALDPVVELGPPPPAYQAPRPDCPPEAKACVDLTNSMTWVQVDGDVVYGPVQQIAGRKDYRTTPGMHTVSWKNIDHVSSIFGTPMPYAVFFTSTGMAFHQGELNIPSHGCVHLTPTDASAYWDLLHVGDTVYVFGEAQY